MFFTLFFQAWIIKVTDSYSVQENNISDIIFFLQMDHENSRISQ